MHKRCYQHVYFVHFHHLEYHDLDNVYLATHQALFKIIKSTTSYQ